MKGISKYTIETKIVLNNKETRINKNKEMKLSICNW